MADCMRRISLSWSPQASPLLDCRALLVPLWGDEDSAVAGTDSGAGGAIEGLGDVRSCSLSVAAGEPKSSMISFSSSESRASTLSLLCLPRLFVTSLTSDWHGSVLGGWTSDKTSCFCGLQLGFSGCSLGLLVPCESGEPGRIFVLTRSSFSLCVSLCGGFLVVVVSPNVSRSMRSISKSSPLFAKDAQLLWETLAYRSRKERFLQTDHVLCSYAALLDHTDALAYRWELLFLHRTLRHQVENFPTSFFYEG